MFNSYHDILYNEKKTQLTSLILIDSKITVMTVSNVILLDILCYRLMLLCNIMLSCNLPKTFGFQNEAVAGFFAHLFNTSDNSNYIRNRL